MNPWAKGQQAQDELAEQESEMVNDLYQRTIRSLNQTSSPKHWAMLMAVMLYAVSECKDPIAFLDLVEDYRKVHNLP